MEVSDLISRTENFSCEEPRLELPPNQISSTSPNLILLAKLITSKDTNISYVRDVTLKAWKTVYPMEVKRLNKNTFMFSFHHEVDAHRVFTRRPWSCHGGHLVLKKWSPDITWQEIDFSTTTLWAQIHGLPALWKTEDNIRKIGTHIGVVQETDLIGELGGAWKKFLRVRVDIPVDKPLRPGFFLPRPNNTDTWVGLKYEKLADFCYNCGVIVHEAKACESNPFQLINLKGFCFMVAGPWLCPGNDDIPTGALEGMVSRHGESSPTHTQNPGQPTTKDPHSPTVSTVEHDAHSTAPIPEKVPLVTDSTVLTPNQ